MTKEEAIEILKTESCADCAVGSQSYYTCIIDGHCNVKEAMEMAIKALDQPTTKDYLASGDCVSRKAVFEAIDDCNSDGLKGIFCSYKDGERFKEYIKKLSPVTPTQCIATVQFNKEELRDICNERIEIACQHGTCKDCKNNRKNPYARKHYTCELGNRYKLRDCEDFYCADFEKRGDET